MKFAVAAAAVVLCGLPLAAAEAREAAIAMPPLVVKSHPQRPLPQFPLPLRHYHQPPLAMSSRAAAAAGPLPTFTANSRPINGQVYSYTMLGNSPFVKETVETPSIPVVLIPVIWTVWQNDPPMTAVFDPTQPDPVCSPTGSAISLIQNSPVFTAAGSIVLGPTTINGLQLISTYYRANFWRWTNPNGINPNFGIHLQATVAKPLAITILTDGPNNIVAAPCGQIAFIPFDDWDYYISTTLFRQLQKTITPNVVPIFIFYGVFMSLDDGGVFAGAHLTKPNPVYNGALQIYATSNFDMSQGNPTNQDVLDLEHEAAELTVDSYGNAVPPWGNVGEVQGGCSNIMEVADPLTGTSFSLGSPSGFTYHLQDVAFLPWFFDAVPSYSVNGWYSFFGSFTSPAAPCSSN